MLNVKVLEIQELNIYKENYKISRYIENGNCDQEFCGVYGECLWYGSF